jgi:hypothetical protein
MSVEQDNKAIVGRWFTSFWGEARDLSIVDELAAPDMLLHYSLHEPRRGREDRRGNRPGRRRLRAQPTRPHQGHGLKSIGPCPASAGRDRIDLPLQGDGHGNRCIRIR